MESNARRQRSGFHLCGRMSAPMRKQLLFVIILAASSAVAQQRLPAPQIASAEGRPAPDFNLQDQSGKALRLSSLRGSRVLLVFYRGHW